ncbi:MAG: PepSY domain-containing protein [Nitrospira sp.]|nr:PepSY domain-containing protein [Nitrospira sp.]
MTMHKLVITLAVVGGLVLAFGNEAWSDEKAGKNKAETKDKIEMAAAAKVTIEQAAKTVSDKVHGKVIEAELEKKHGKLVWEVEVVTLENRLLTVHVDADSGRVIDVEEKEAEREKPRERKREHQP